MTHHEVVDLVEAAGELVAHRLGGVRHSALHRAQLAGRRLHQLLRERPLDVEEASGAAGEGEGALAVVVELEGELGEHVSQLIVEPGLAPGVEPLRSLEPGGLPPPHEPPGLVSREEAALRALRQQRAHRVGRDLGHLGVAALHGAIVEGAQAAKRRARVPPGGVA